MKSRPEPKCPLITTSWREASARRGPYADACADPDVRGGGRCHRNENHPAAVAILFATPQGPPFIVGFLISAYAVCRLVAGPWSGCCRTDTGEETSDLQPDRHACRTRAACVGQRPGIGVSGANYRRSDLGQYFRRPCPAAEHSAPATARALGTASGAIGTELRSGAPGFLVQFGVMPRYGGGGIIEVSALPQHAASSDRPNRRLRTWAQSRA